MRLMLVAELLPGQMATRALVSFQHGAEAARYYTYLALQVLPEGIEGIEERMASPELFRWPPDPEEGNWHRRRFHGGSLLTHEVMRQVAAAVLDGLVEEA